MDRTRALGRNLAVLRRVLQSGRLRRVELAFCGFALAEMGVWIAMLVYAYNRGGTTAAGLIAVLQLVPAAIVAPLAARMTERHGGARALLVGYMMQALAMATGGATMLTDGPAALAYAAAVVTTSVVTVTRPAQTAVLASLVDRPEELTAATVVSGWVESASLCAGPAVAGVLLALNGPGLAFVVFAAAVFCSALLVAPVAVGTMAAHTPEPGAIEEEGIASASAKLLSSRPALALVCATAVQFVAMGALDVLLVVLAIDTLGLGQPGAGYLSALFGAGAVLGAGAAIGLVGARSLLRPLASSAVVWAVAFALLAAFTTTPSAVVVLLIAGACRSLLDTSGRALLARVTPLAGLGSMFGLLEGLAMVGFAIGAAIVPPLVAISGVELALGVLAAALALAVLAPLRQLLIADRTAPATDAIRLLRAHPLFAPLPVPALEELARDLVTVSVAAGQTLIREGEAGDRFYLIAVGEFDVTITGDHVTTLGPGEGFGEIALLRNIPRTATVSARIDAMTYGLAREPFLSAMMPAV